MAFSIADEPMEGWVVLVVDDEPDSLEVAQMLLEYYGADVITASNGKDGLSTAKQNMPDIIVADLSMPEMSGWAMLHQLRKDPYTKRIPVIALTAHVMRGDRTRVLQAGFHNHISKPLNPDTFVNDLLNSLTTIPEMEAKLLAYRNDRGG